MAGPVHAIAACKRYLLVSPNSYSTHLRTHFRFQHCKTFFSSLTIGTNKLVRLVLVRLGSLAGAYQLFSLWFF